MKQSFHPPAFCLEHGIFPVQAIKLAPGIKGATFISCRTNCPQCGGAAEIISGTYDTRQDRLNILIDRSISPDALAAIKNLVERLQSGAISPEEAKEEAESISPKVGQLFDIAGWSDQAKATLYAAIIGATAIIYAARNAPSPHHVVNIQPVIERVIEVEKSDLKSVLQSSSAMKPVHAPLPKRKPTPPRRKRR